MDKTKTRTALDLLREQLTMAQYDLLVYSKHQGESPVLDANIRHKREQVEDLERRVLALEDEQRTAASGGCTVRCEISRNKQSANKAVAPIEAAGEDKRLHGEQMSMLGRV